MTRMQSAPASAVCDPVAASLPVQGLVGECHLGTAHILHRKRQFAPARRHVLAASTTCAAAGLTSASNGCALLAAQLAVATGRGREALAFSQDLSASLPCAGVGDAEVQRTLVDAIRLARATHLGS